MSTRARSGLLPENMVTGRAEIDFSDERWEQISLTMPHPLSTESSVKFRSLTNECCNRFLTTTKLARRAALTRQSVKKPGGKQAPPLDRLERHLKSADKIFGTIENMLDDRPGLIQRYRAQVMAMAEDIVARRKALRELKPVTINPKHELVRSLAKACESCGLKVTATNRVYDEKANRPTWFQEFVAAVNDALLGAQGWGAAGSDKKALYSDVVKALSSKTGIPRK